jgi:hypothetical protein
MKIIIPKLGSDSSSSPAGVFVSMNSSTVPRAELYVGQSSAAACTSANRLNA